MAYGGQFESAAEAGRLLAVLGLAVIVGIGFLLSLAFGSFRDAALIMVNLPLALIGGIAGVYAAGGVLSVASLIGFITVFGIATRNGIMLVSHIRHLQEHEGVTEFREAVVRGAMERLAPILMTALGRGAGADSPGPGGRAAWQRNPNPDGDGHSLRAPDVDVPQYGGRAGPVPAVRAAGAADRARRCVVKDLCGWTVIILVVLAGCARGPSPGPTTSARSPAVAPGETPPVVGAAPGVMPVSAPTAPAASAPALPGARLERLTLADALARAERFHPELAVSQALIARAEGRALQAGLLPNPELVARLESAPLTGQFTAQAEYVAGISQAIPLGPRLARARQAELLDRDRLTSEGAARRLEIRMGVQRAFATAFHGQRVIQAREEDVRSAANGVALAQARLAAGDTIPAEVAQAEMELRRAELERDNATADGAQAFDALGAALGDATLAIGALDGPPEEALTVPALAALAARLEASPFLAAATAEMAVQRAQLEVVQAQRTPDVHVDLFYHRLSDHANAMDVGVRLPLQLFDRGQGRLQATRAELAAAEARARTIRSDQTLRLQTAHRKLARAVAAATVLQEAILPRAAQVLQGAEARYRAGDLSLTELVPLRRDWTRVRLDALEALHDVMQAWAELSPYLWRRPDGLLETTRVPSVRRMAQLQDDARRSGSSYRVSRTQTRLRRVPLHPPRRRGAPLVPCARPSPLLRLPSRPLSTPDGRDP